MVAASRKEEMTINPCLSASEGLGVYQCLIGCTCILHILPFMHLSVSPSASSDHSPL